MSRTLRVLEEPGPLCAAPLSPGIPAAATDRADRPCTYATERIRKKKKKHDLNDRFHDISLRASGNPNYYTVLYSTGGTDAQWHFSPARARDVFSHNIPAVTKNCTINVYYYEKITFITPSGAERLFIARGLPGPVFDYFTHFFFAHSRTSAREINCFF